MSPHRPISRHARHARPAPDVPPSAGGGAGPLDRAANLAWRRVERERLIALRSALPADERRHHGAAIARHLDALLGDLRGCTVGVYWPFRGEPALRDWMLRLHAGGAHCALPVVVERGAPLVFRAWQPGAPMARGVWNIPVPADGAVLRPDVVVAPVVGFDPAGYRLGYGGGFYDRTLAALAPRPRAVGVGFEVAAIETLHPLPHDIPMDAIVTEQGCRVRRERRERQEGAAP